MAKRSTFSIEEFCQWAGIGRTHYFKLQKRGTGPAETRIGASVSIAKDTAASWLKQQETSHASRGTTVPAVEEEVVATSVRLPKSMHDALADIVYAERKRGNRISIHSLILEGTAKVIKEKSATKIKGGR
jgi:predicted DNA-binding transcriptional regulator AlpA